MSERGLLFFGSLIPLLLGLIAILYKRELVRWRINRNRYDYFDKNGELRYDERRFEIQTALQALPVLQWACLEL